MFNKFDQQLSILKINSVNNPENSYSNSITVFFNFLASSSNRILKEIVYLSKDQFLIVVNDGS